VDALNQLLEAEGTSYTYDSNGNLASKTADNKSWIFQSNNLDNKTWVFQSNSLNQLVSIKDPDQNVISFVYDLNGKRLAKKVEAKGKKAKVLRYFYLGQTEIGSLDEKGVINELKIPIDPNDPEGSPCIAFEIKKAIYIPIYDLQGHVSCLIDAKKREVVESYRYSSFGEEEIRNQSGKIISDSVVGNPWRYFGKRVDPETGLVCFGNRYYDPKIGRWTSPDPLGDMDGPNLYAFCRNNPLTYIDYFCLAAEVNSNQSDGFDKYFYGEYEPHCFCERHRDCTD
jgi:RHS repeat-associated protein